MWSFLGWSRSLHSTETCRGRAESPGPAQLNDYGRSQSLVNHNNETRLSLKTQLADELSISSPCPRRMKPRKPYQMIRESFKGFVTDDTSNPEHGCATLTIKSPATLPCRDHASQCLSEVSTPSRGCEACGTGQDACSRGSSRCMLRNLCCVFKNRWAARVYLNVVQLLQA